MFLNQLYYIVYNNKQLIDFNFKQHFQIIVYE